VHDLLLQKSNGAFELVVWGERVKGSNDITVSFARTQAKVKIFDTAIGVTPTRILTNVVSILLTMSDHALIIEIE
jgi:hypothetical protein